MCSGSDRLHQTEANGGVSEMQRFFSLNQFKLQAKLETIPVGRNLNTITQSLMQPTTCYEVKQPKISSFVREVPTATASPRPGPARRLYTIVMNTGFFRVVR